MKMSFLRKTRKNNIGSGRTIQPGLSRPLLALLFFAGIVGLFATLGASPAKGALATLARPFWYVEENLVASLSTFTSYFSSKATLAAENASLNARFVEQEVRLRQVEQLTQENEELKAAFGRTNTRVLIQVAVLRAPGNSPYDTYLIDAGQNMHLRQNARVYFSSTTAAGYISEVFLNTALVKLYSSPNETVSVYAGDRRVFTQAQGMGGGNFALSLPHDSGVQKDAAAYLPGTPTLLLGTVSTIETDVAKSLQTAHFRSPYNLSETHFLYVE